MFLYFFVQLTMQSTGNNSASLDHMLNDDSDLAPEQCDGHTSGGIFFPSKLFGIFKIYHTISREYAYVSFNGSNYFLLYKVRGDRKSVE